MLRTLLVKEGASCSSYCLAALWQYTGLQGHRKVWKSAGAWLVNPSSFEENGFVYIPVKIRKGIIPPAPRFRRPWYMQRGWWLRYSWAWIMVWTFRPPNLNRGPCRMYGCVAIAIGSWGKKDEKPKMLPFLLSSFSVQPKGSPLMAYRSRGGTNYGLFLSKFQILWGQSHNPNPNMYSTKMSQKQSFFRKKYWLKI